MTFPMLTPLMLAEAAALNNTVVVPQMEGVTTAIVAFIFVCIVYPATVRNKTQFYGAFALVLIIILLHSLNIMFGSSSAGVQVFTGALTGLLQVGAIVLLFMSCGGVSPRELAGEMKRAYEVIRRGEEEKEIIIPIGNEQPRPRQQPPVASPTEAPSTHNIEAPPAAGWPKKSGDSSIPLE